MTQSIKTALENVKEIYMSDSALATLLDFERVLDELDVYAFKNWKVGELVAGPEYEKYFVSATFMWPYKLMPDPRGGEQLLNYNCEVVYKEEQLEYPVKPKSPKDFRPGTKMAKTKKVPVWLVTITMPKKLIKEIEKGSIEIENERLNIEDLQQSYEEGVDEESAKDDSDDQMQDQQGMGQQPGGMGMQPGGMPMGGAPNGPPQQQF